MNYYIITYGCQMNKSDSERIKTVLENIGYQPAKNIEQANLIIINMCSVRQSAVDRVYGKISQILKIKKQNKKTKYKIILTGCILPGDKEKLKNQVDSILDIKDLQSWKKYFSKKISNQNKNLTGCNYFKIKPKYQNKSSVFIPISNGCNNACSYCVVPFTRGPLTCRDYKEILKEVKNAVKNGAKEIWLLGQNVNNYHSTSKTKFQNKKLINFSELLTMIDKIPGNFKIFFTSPNPSDFTDELIETMAKCKKIAHYLNLPIQSGDDKILKKMNRKYSVKEYKNLIKKIRKKIPDIYLSTDIIVGFPNETKKQFQNTLKLFKEIKFNNAYISKYSPRPGTVAFKMKDNISLDEKEKREKILRNLLKKWRKN